jgi:hypothetical protein
MVVVPHNLRGGSTGVYQDVAHMLTRLLFNLSTYTNDARATSDPKKTKAPQVYRATSTTL